MKYTTVNLHHDCTILENVFGGYFAIERLGEIGWDQGNTTGQIQTCMSEGKLSHKFQDFS